MIPICNWCGKVVPWTDGYRFCSYWCEANLIVIGKRDTERVIQLLKDQAELRPLIPRPD